MTQPSDLLWVYTTTANITNVWSGMKHQLLNKSNSDQYVQYRAYKYNYDSACYSTQCSVDALRFLADNHTTWRGGTRWLHGRALDLREISKDRRVEYKIVGQAHTHTIESDGIWGDIYSGLSACMITRIDKYMYFNKVFCENTNTCIIDKYFVHFNKSLL